MITQKLIEETGAKINVPPPSVYKDEVVVSGEKEGVHKAVATIMAIYEEKVMIIIIIIMMIVIIMIVIIYIYCNNNNDNKNDRSKNDNNNIDTLYFMRVTQSNRVLKLPVV